MNAQSRRHHSVIVGVDPSDEARRALHWAAAEAQRRRWPMQIVHAVQTDDQGVAQKIVDTALADVRAAWPGVDVMGESVADDTATALARTATDRDILVVGSRGLGRIASVLVGSVSSAVARHATCPVVVVRDPNTLPRHPESTSGVILGVDGSEASISAAGFAFEAASLRGRPLTVVHAVWDPYTESQAVVAILSDPERVVRQGCDAIRERPSRPGARRAERWGGSARRRRPRSRAGCHPAARLGEPSRAPAGKLPGRSCPSPASRTISLTAIGYQAFFRTATGH